MLRGYLRGFVKEFLSIFSIFISGYISIYFYPNISLFIKKYLEMGVIADIISLSILFFFIYSCFSTIIKFITKKLIIPLWKFLIKTLNYIWLYKSNDFFIHY